MMQVVEIVMPSQIPNNVPAFLSKLWKMVDNPDSGYLISWAEGGASFLIKNQTQLTKSLLPYYYKHSNMASFVRQLNMYGFRKVISADAGALKGEKEEIEFAHSFFIQGQEHLLEHIKRKVTSAGKSSAGVKHEFLPSLSSDKVTEVLIEVGQLKDKQEEMDGRLDVMKNENEALWGEVMTLRLRYSQQQKTVNKLIQFLSALVKPRGRKRSFQPSVGGGHLALQGHRVGVKQVKVNTGLVNDEFVGTEVQLSLQEAVTVSGPEGGAQATLQSEFISCDRDDDQGQLAHAQAMAMMDTDGQEEETQVLATPVMLKENLDIDINNMDKELDNMKNILSGQLTVDTSMVTDLFGKDIDFSNLNMFNNMPINLEENTEQSGGLIVPHPLPSPTLPGMFLTFPDHDYAEAATDLEEGDALGFIY